VKEKITILELARQSLRERERIPQPEATACGFILLTFAIDSVGKRGIRSSGSEASRAAGFDLGVARDKGVTKCRKCFDVWFNKPDYR
jgi:hypothetical protein